MQQILDRITQPVVEIAGPTPHGYKIAEKLGLTIRKPIITNITKQTTVYTPDDTPHDYIVDDIADIRNFKHADKSIGILLCSYLPNIDDDTKMTWQEAEKFVDSEYDKALTVKTIKKEDFRALHIVLLMEAKRVLVPGCVLILQGTHKLDTQLAEALGFKPMVSPAIEDETESQFYLQ